MMFVLFDVVTSRWHVMVWSLDKAKALKTSSTRFICQMPADLADSVVEKTVPVGRYYEGIARYAQMA